MAGSSQVRIILMIESKLFAGNMMKTRKIDVGLRITQVLLQVVGGG